MQDFSEMIDSRTKIQKLLFSILIAVTKYVAVLEDINFFEVDKFLLQTKFSIFRKKF